jgi:hypothetical protein
MYQNWISSTEIGRQAGALQGALRNPTNACVIKQSTQSPDCGVAGRRHAILAKTFGSHGLMYNTAGGAGSTTKSNRGPYDAPVADPSESLREPKKALHHCM